MQIKSNFPRLALNALKISIFLCGDGEKSDHVLERGTTISR
jgi:hypothetical protein